MRKITFLISLVICLVAGSNLFAQIPANDNFVNAIPICPNTKYSGTNKQATVEAFEISRAVYYNACFDSTDNTVWYKFKTNYLGGHVQVRFTNVSCLLSANKGDSLEASIIDFNYDTLSGNPNESYVVSGCSQGGSGTDFVVSSAFPLKPLYEYYIAIDGVGHFEHGNSAECDFTIEIYGEASDITIETIPGNASRSLILGQRVLLDAVGADESPDNVAWTANGIADWDVIEDPNSKTTYVFPKEENTTYKVVSSNGFNTSSLICYLRDSIVFYVNEQLNPYNTFTPNGDLVNDLWEIPKIDDIREFENAEVTVYNRWGQIVYKIIGYDNKKGWDGTHNGQPVPEATYYWTINLNDLYNNNRKYAGSVTIIR